MENQKPSGIFGQRELGIIQKLKKNFLWIGVYVLIGGVVLGAALIVTGGTEAGEYIAKAMGMFLVFAVMMLVSSNNFKILESGRDSAQIMALVGLVMNFVWGILWTLAIWNIFDVMAYKTCDYGYYGSSPRQCTDGFSIMGQIALIATYLSAWGFFGSNIMSVKEYDRKNAITPLKITALICLTYCVLFAMAVVINKEVSQNLYKDRMAMLSSFAGLVWVVTWIIAAVLSRGGKKKADKAMQAPSPVPPVQPVPTPRPPVQENEAEMRARIEEKVRREMEIEKEVRTRLEKENTELHENPQEADSNSNL